MGTAHSTSRVVNATTPQWTTVHAHATKCGELCSRTSCTSCTSESCPSVHEQPHQQCSHAQSMTDFTTLLQLLLKRHAACGSRELVDIEVKKDLAVVTAYWLDLCSEKENRGTNFARTSKPQKKSASTRKRRQRLVEGMCLVPTPRKRTLRRLLCLRMRQTHCAHCSHHPSWQSSKK